MPPRVNKATLEAIFKTQIEDLEKDLAQSKADYAVLSQEKEQLEKKLSLAEKQTSGQTREIDSLKKARSELESKLRSTESELAEVRRMEVALRQQVESLLELNNTSMLGPGSSEPMEVDSKTKASRTPPHTSKPPTNAPDTNGRVKDMLSAWESKGRPNTAPDLSKLPSVFDEASLKRKPETMESNSAPQSVNVTALFDFGPILEIPEDLLEELNTLSPVERDRRLSIMKIEAEEKRKSEKPSTGPLFPDPGPAPEPPMTLSGRVAAALKLFTGSSVPKPAIIAPWSASKRGGYMNLPKIPESVPSSTGTQPAPIPEDIDGAEIEGSQTIDPITAAAQVAEEEAELDELEKSVWLADIEEIKIASTPAKKGTNDSYLSEWSVVSQKMNLACQLTPVVPGRRSCITVAQPKMVPVAPKNPEDQYDFTDKDTDSEDELSPNSRSKKHIPPWCSQWRQKAIAQIAVDPESIFGANLPKCDLDLVFTESNYRKMGLQRPKRTRGSSGNWTFDKLTQDEIDRYRAKCGQVVKAEGVFDINRN
jgi:hypothetical protein